jgi:hypothetical protein
VVSEPGTCLCISGKRRKEEHSDTHDLRQSGIRAGVSLLSVAETEKTQCRQEENDSRLIVKTGTHEEGVDKQVT